MRECFQKLDPDWMRVVSVALLVGDEVTISLIQECPEQSYKNQVRNGSRHKVELQKPLKSRIVFY